MPSANENKLLLRDCVVEILDSQLAPLGLARNPKSLVFSRKLPLSIHELHLFIESNPRYAPGITMHILPTVCVRMPELGKIAVQMVENGRLLGELPDLVVTHQLQNLVKENGYDRWLASDAATCRQALEAINDCFKKWAEPFLQDYKSPDDFLGQYELGDRRPFHTHSYYLYVAAAYMLKGANQKALAVLNTHLGKPGLKRMYSKAFDFAA